MPCRHSMWKQIGTDFTQKNQVLYLAFEGCFKIQKSKQSFLNCKTIISKSSVADTDPHGIDFGELDPDPDSHWEYGFGSRSRRAQITHKSEENSSFEMPDRYSLSWDEEFCCSLDVLYGGLGTKIAIFDQKNIFFPAVNLFQFLVIKNLDLDPDTSPSKDLICPKYHPSYLIICFFIIVLKLLRCCTV